MLLDYLKSIQEKDISSRIELEEEYDLVDTKLREARKFLSMIEEEDPDTFTEFSPYELQSKNEKQMKEIEDSIASFEKKMSSLQNQIFLVDDNLDKIEKAMQEFQELSNDLQASDSDSVIPSENAVVLDQDNNISIYNDLIFQCDNILGFLPVDPVRAKIELGELKKSLQSLMK